MFLDDDVVQADYEDQLQKEHKVKQKASAFRNEPSPKIINEDEGNDNYEDDSMERYEYEQKLLEEHNRRDKVRRSNEAEAMPKMGLKGPKEEQKSKIHPPMLESTQVQSKKSQELEERARREKELKLIKERQESAKKKQALLEKKLNRRSEENSSNAQEEDLDQGKIYLINFSNNIYRKKYK